MMYSLYKEFLILGKLLVLNQERNISPFLMEILTFLGICIQTLAIPKNLQVLKLFSFMSPPHELHAIDILL
jgi:hypothetical protein